MKKLILLSILLLTFMLNTYAIETVENKVSKSNKIVIKLMFKNGSIADPQGKEGLTYTTANTIINGGTGKLSFSDIKDKTYPMAVRYSVSVDKEVTIFTFEVHKDWVEAFYPILTGLILNPSFAEADFQRIKSDQQVFVDQVIRASSDEEYSKKALEDLLYRGTPYQHMVEGKSESVKSISLDDVKQQYKSVFTKNNLILGIAGNYTAAFLKKLQNDLNKLPDTKVNLPLPVNPKTPDGINVEIISKDNAFGSAIFMGTPMSITRSNKDFAALMVANSYLGEHRKSYSKLYQLIRETRSMNYGDYSYIEWYKNGGYNMLPPSGVPRSSQYFGIWIRPVQIAKQLKNQYPELNDITVGHGHFAIRMALNEVNNLIQNGMTDQDFKSTQSFLRSYIKLYVKSTSEQLGYLVDSKFYGMKDYVNTLDKALANLTLADVNNAIKKYWTINNMYITIVTDKSEAEPLAESLRNNTVSPMAYSNTVKAGLNAKVLNEDKNVENFKLNIKSVKVIESKDTFK